MFNRLEDLYSDVYSIKLTLEQLEHIFATISNGDTQVKVLNLVIDDQTVKKLSPIQFASISSLPKVNLFHVNITTQAF